MYKEEKEEEEEEDQERISKGNLCIFSLVSFFSTFMLSRFLPQTGRFKKKVACLENTTAGVRFQIQ